MFGWYDENQTRMGLAYLFLSSEGRISEADYALFEKFGKSTKGFAGWKKEVVEECENLLASAKSAASRSKIVSEFFSTYQKSGKRSTRSGFGFFSGGELSEKNSRNILFTLASLACLSEKQSAAKQKLVKLWAEANCIDKSVLIEMQDTLESEQAIDGYRKWLQAAIGTATEQVEPVMAELDKNLKELRDGANALIALG